MKRLVFGLLLFPTLAIGQGYPQDYFRNPLGIPILLAGNFGECRPGHFHSGIDIKTEGRENLPVYAAAEGYISRIKMEPGGFGHGLYITHPSGYTSLYAHLNNFIPRVQAYVRKQQYAKESWTVDLSFRPEQFPVKKGEQIAWSGNTGGSTAPHLHFEIRDSKTEHPLNPQLFGLEVKDSRGPVIKKLAIYNMERSIYDLGPQLINLRKGNGNEYIVPGDTISVSTQLAGIGIVSDDYMEGSDNTLAWYTAEWYMDDTLQGRIRLDDIGYDETRYLHAYADYRTRQGGGPWVQCLFRLPGNMLTRIYESLNPNYGLIQRTDGQYRNMLIVLTDVSGNKSEVRFQLRNTASYATPPCSLSFYAGKQNPVEYSNVAFMLDERQLYADVCMPVSSIPDSSGISDRFNIGRGDVPVHHYFDLQLRPGKLIPFSQRSKIAMVYRDGRREDGRAAQPGNQGWYKASVRNLGTDQLVVDTLSPSITPLAPIKGSMAKAKQIAVRATDDITSIKTFRATLDGSWILFEQHGDVWTYVFDEHCSKGTHKLTITATDENGNATSSNFVFSR
jgi:hypothetical protein